MSNSGAPGLRNKAFTIAVGDIVVCNGFERDTVRARFDSAIGFSVRSGVSLYADGFGFFLPLVGINSPIRSVAPSGNPLLDLRHEDVVTNHKLLGFPFLPSGACPYRNQSPAWGLG